MFLVVYDIVIFCFDVVLEFLLCQQVVLQYVLNFLVEGGEKVLIMVGLVCIVSCFKESFYKWFGDWDGLLVVVVVYQVSQVQFFFESGVMVDVEIFCVYVIVFVEVLLGVLFF